MSHVLVSSTSDLGFMILILLMNLCFAVALPLLKQAVWYGDPLLVVAIRMIIGSIVVSMLYGMSSEVVQPIRLWNWRLLMGTACISMYAVCVGEAIALEHMSATKASLIWSLLPCITAFIGRVFYQQQLRVWHWLGIGMGTAGMVLLAMFSTPVGEVTHTSISADMLMLGSVCAAGWAYFLIQRVVVEGHGILVSNAITMLMSGLLSLGTWYCWCNTTLAMPMLEWRLFLWYVAVVALLVNGIGLSLQSFLITRYSASLLALSSCMSPVFGVCIGVYVGGDVWHRGYTAALACIMLGLVLFYYEELQRMCKGVYA